MFIFKYEVFCSGFCINEVKMCSHKCVCFMSFTAGNFSKTGSVQSTAVKISPKCSVRKISFIYRCFSFSPLFSLHDMEDTFSKGLWLLVPCGCAVIWGYGILADRCSLPSQVLSGLAGGEGKCGRAECTS